ncbi:hypothetical protein [Paenibacillus radicis (ex Gao et al. 2016)]|uniref:CBM-cenC domain-containing protein n=1 Tax=Paenibacillus radicis (ex Gao et al. 2016) TaxID=1737354 RepID=A0A917H5R4_9BACL|nr:hypothetical protein [Paenibacillus radicis (ex Gao et al. 2016)]GGG68382.1 hypothetical protein GCM10010918_24080 [Paenibacillus radicis (ex Gao et al. 2016)]
MKVIKIIMLVLIMSSLIPSVSYSNVESNQENNSLDINQNNNLNLLHNPSFEMAGTNGVGEGWQYWRGEEAEADITLVNSLVSSGLQAQRISASILKKDSFVALTQLIPVSPNKPFYLGGRFNIEQLNNAKIQLYADFLTADSSFITSVIFELRNDLKGTYITLSGNNIVPQEAASVRIFALIRATSDIGSGIIYVDDLNFKYTSESNLVMNADFDQVENQNAIADSWFPIVGGKTSLSVVTSPISSGGTVQRVTSSELPLHQIGGIYQILKVDPNREFRISVRVRVDSLKDSKIQLYADFSDATSLLQTNIVDISTVTNGDFITISGKGKTPDKAKHLALYTLIRSLSDSGAGDIYVDSMSFSYQLEEESFDNASFESFEGSGIAKGWSYTGISSFIQKENIRVSDGKYAQKINTSNLLKNQFTGISQSIIVQPNKDYTISGRILVDSLQNANMYLQTDFYGQNGIIANKSNIVELSRTTFGGYITISGMGTVPEDAHYAKVQVIIKAKENSGAGVFFIDDMSFQYN